MRCTFPAVVQIKVLPPGGFRVLRGASPFELMRARIAAKRSSLAFDRRYCRATPVPGVK